MTTSISPIQEVRGALANMKPQFERALPRGVDPDKFLRVAETAVQNTKDILDADRGSLYAACTKAAQDGLLPDGREGALVTFNTKVGDQWMKQVQWMPMVQGLVKLARNSGEIANIVSEVVYKNDKFTYRIGLDEMPLHEPDWFAEDRGEPIGAWALITLTNGEKIPAVLPKSKILRIAGKSKNAKQYNPSEGAYFDEWWKKTAIKNVLKYAPKSTEMERLDKLMEREASEEFQEFNLEPELASEAPKKPAVSKKLSELKKAHQVQTEPTGMTDVTPEGEVEEEVF